MGYSLLSPLPPRICSASLATSNAAWVQKVFDAIEYPIEKIFRDARAALIEDGTNDVLSLAGAKLMLARPS